MKLTAGELKVMQLLWQHGEMKPSEIQEKFPEDIKNSPYGPISPSCSKKDTSIVDKSVRHFTTRRRPKNDERSSRWLPT